MFDLKIVRAAEQLTTEWSGGETTQIFIWPPGSDYAARLFGWRVSSARICDAKSTFTKLAGVRRCIMPIEGSVTLTHEGERALRLDPFDSDCFMGDWTTTSESDECVTDFNLMTTAEYRGAIGSLGDDAESVSFRPNPDARSLSAGIYSLVDDLSAEFKVAGESRKIVLDRHDFAVALECRSAVEIFFAPRSSAGETIAVSAAVWASA